MAYDQIAADLAAAYYAATPTPDPTLDPESDPAVLAAYYRTGRRFASALLTPKDQALIRCPCGTRAAHPDRFARVLATVHDRDLLIFQESRGYLDHGLRLEERVLVDVPLAQREGQRSARVCCPGCGAVHELGFGWLQRARHNTVSTPSEQLVLAPWGDLITSEGHPPPASPNDVEHLAFAQTTGPLDGSTLLITLPFLRAFNYKNQFGFKPPYEEHLLRLIGDGDPRVELPGLREMLTPQWRKLQADPEERRLQQADGPLDDDELQALRQALAEEDPLDREEDLLTLQYMLQEQDFRALQQSLTEEPR